MPNLSSPTAVSAARRTLDERGFRRLIHRATVALIAALGVPLLIMLALILFLLRSGERVEGTRLLISQAREVETLLVTMQSAMRGYCLVPDQRYLEPFRAARAKIGPAITALEKFGRDKPERAQEYRDLQRYLNDWIALASNTIAAPAPDKTSLETILAEGAGLMDRSRGCLASIVEAEKAVLTERAKTLHTLVVALYFSVGLAAIFGVPLGTLWLQSLLRRASGAYQGSLTEAERRANELHVTLRSIGDGVVATNARGRIDFLNPVAETLTGWTNAEAQGRGIEEVFAIYKQGNGKAAVNPIRRILHEVAFGEADEETYLRSRSGAEFAIENSAALIRGENEEVLGAILVFRDVAKKRDADRQIREAQQRAQFLHELGDATRNLLGGDAIMEASTRLLGQHLKASRCAYAEVDPETNEFVIPHDYCDNCASTKGHYHLSLFGPRADAAMHAGRTLVVRDVDAELGAGEGAETFKAIGIRAIICCPLIKEGKLLAMMAVHQVEPRDWTEVEIHFVKEVVERCWATIERARAEEEAKVRAERFRLLSEVVSLQVWTANPGGELDYVNARCVEYFGLSTVGEVLKDGWTRFVHPDDLSTTLKHWGLALAQERGYESEFRLQNAAGEYRWFITRAEALLDGSGRPAKWFGSNTDIHDLKIAQGKAEQANRAKDAFLAALSHELRTPLAPVLMSASALRDDPRLPADVHSELEMMERNIALEARLIDDLLDVTSIAQGKLQLRKQPCDAHALIKLAIEIVAKDAAAKQISIDCECLATRAEIQADPARFQQVIWNLLRNAVKFTPRGGWIKIRTRDAAEEKLQIEVEDRGIGIDPHLLETIFSPFEQGGLTGDHRFGGMGLGLSIARAILHAHGGSIQASSEGAGQGATFCVEIPEARVCTARPAEPLAHSLSTRPEKGEKGERGALRLLLVEDHEATLGMMLKLLSRDGHQVTPVQSAAAALEAARAEPFDLVISDLGLPDLSGIDLMAQLRDEHKLRGIALSGYGSEQDIARARGAGFILHLTKPVHFGELRQALASL